MNNTGTKNQPSPDQLMHSLLAAARAVEERIEAALGSVGLSAAKLNVLSALASSPDGTLTLSELAARIACVRSNVTQLVDRLETDGLVRREDHPEDRRSIRAALTPLGRDRQKAGEEQLDKVRSDFGSSLSAGDCAALGKALGAIG